ncbi:peptidase M23 [Fibrobacter sp. UWT3]|uniref:peptidase M23 n=1 Tax=Fibrobacter sp. UWT3 TaxID=1896225 RepID=UPI000BE457B8|nr:peptidase M23 [Fibrobacter sp. UWT3]
MAVVLFVRLGFAEKVVQLLPGSTVVEASDWKSRCETMRGKAFELKNGLGQCSWVVSDSVFYLPNDFLRYIASQTNSMHPKLHWVAPRDRFSEAVLVQVEDSLVRTFIHVRGQDSLYYWVDIADGCRYPGLCPRQPLDWSALTITGDFDFEGQESLLAMDAMLGIGEAPIHPILPGIVLSSGKDSLGQFVVLDHGNNVTSRMSGMYPVNPADTLPFLEGEYLDMNSIVGRLAPRDSATFYLTVRHNGFFVRWADLYSQTHPLDSAEIAKFLQKIEL